MQDEQDRHDAEQSLPPSEQSGGHGGDPYNIRFYIEEPTGNVYRAEALSTTRVEDVATDFFEERNWPTRDQAGRPQRAVVEIVNQENPEQTTRVRGDQTLEEAGVRNDDTLRVHPESVAGLYNPHDRLRALILDYREVQALAASDPDNIILDANSEYNPTGYRITFHYPGVAMGTHGLEVTREHQVDIVLPANYPLVAPVVRWITPIFHPNISPQGAVCLGVLAERYMPGVGLAYIVRMLGDIVRYRNYDLHGVLNADAKKWAESEEGQLIIVNELEGIPLEQPLDILLSLAKQAVREATRSRVVFTPYNRFEQEGE